MGKISKPLAGTPLAHAVCFKPLSSVPVAHMVRDEGPMSPSEVCVKARRAHMVLAAGVLGEMDAGKVKLSPCLPSLPVERQLLVKKSLTAVLLQRVYLIRDYLQCAPTSELLKMQVGLKRQRIKAGRCISTC